MEKKTKNIHSLHELIRSRWSTRSFSDKPIELTKLNSIMEAARWAPSAFNEQPWRFIVGEKGTEVYNHILESLVEWNQLWAVNAPVLVLNIAKQLFTHNNTPNDTYKYDLGQAVAFMIIEAMNQGVVSHQMSGFDSDMAEKSLNISQGYHAVSVTAFGYQGHKDMLTEDFAQLELKPRERKNFDTIVIRGKFND